jgi:hypothetical protein
MTRILPLGEKRPETSRPTARCAVEFIEWQQGGCWDRYYSRSLPRLRHAHCLSKVWTPVSSSRLRSAAKGSRASFGRTPSLSRRSTRQSPRCCGQLPTCRRFWTTRPICPSRLPHAAPAGGGQRLGLSQLLSSRWPADSGTETDAGSVPLGIVAGTLLGLVLGIWHVGPVAGRPERYVNSAERGRASMSHRPGLGTVVADILPINAFGCRGRNRDLSSSAPV